MGFNKKFYQTGGLVASTPPSGGGAFDPLQNFETVTYTGNGSTQKITGYIRKGAIIGGTKTGTSATQSSIFTSYYETNIGSISLWFRRNGSSGELEYLTNTVGGGSTLGHAILINGSQLRVYVNGTAINTTGLNVTDGNWHHVVLTWNLPASGTNVNLYVDNATPLTASVSVGSYTGNSTTSLRLGHYTSQSNNGFSGSIDQVRLFNTALNSTQVGELALETYADPKKSTTDYFGNGSGVALYELDEDAKDTGDAYNGTPTNVNFLGMAFQPDLVWVKGRSISNDHSLFDSVRTATKRIKSNSTAAEDTLLGGVTSFDTNGFTIGSNYNQISTTYVAWCWKAADTTTTIPAGTVGNTIASDVRANQAAGFSIVKWTGNGTAGATVGHGLSSAPDMIITKNISADRTSDAWAVYNSIGGATKQLYLEKTSAYGSSITVYNNTEPTTDVFSIGDWSGINYNGDNFIAYCFHSVDGYQKVGSYSGSSSAVTVTTGFKPRWLMIKGVSGNAAGIGSWVIYDSVRDGVNPNTKFLQANSSLEEKDFSTTYSVDFNDDGFTTTATQNDLINYNGTEYIYLAIA